MSWLTHNAEDLYNQFTTKSEIFHIIILDGLQYPPCLLPSFDIWELIFNWSVTPLPLGFFVLKKIIKTTTIFLPESTKNTTDIKSSKSLMLKLQK